MSGSWANDKRQLTLVALIAVIAVLVAAGIWVVTSLGPGRKVSAYFSNASALFEDNAVQMLGVPIGRIDTITPEGDRVRVDMTITDDDVQLPAELNAVVVSPSLVTGRNVTLFPTYSGGPELESGAVIPLERTAVPLGVDDLTRTATELSTALGPNGLNQKGVLSDALDVGAANLDGNGQALNDTIRNLGDLGGTLSGSSEDLFGTITELQKFVETLKNNDGAIREFNDRIADVSGILADQREELGSALRDLATALDDVTVFVQDNRAIIKSNVDRLVEVTRVLVQQRRALTEILDLAPSALANLANIYDASTGTLNTRANFNELMNPPLVLICKLLAQGAPELPIELPVNIRDLCASLPDAGNLPTLQEILTAAQAGQLPQFPGLLPAAPSTAAAPGAAAAPAPRETPAPAAGGPAAPQTAPPAPATQPTSGSPAGILGGGA